MSRTLTITIIGLASVLLLQRRLPTESRSVHAGGSDAIVHIFEWLPQYHCPLWNSASPQPLISTGSRCVRTIIHPLSRHLTTFAKQVQRYISPLLTYHERDPLGFIWTSHAQSTSCRGLPPATLRQLGRSGTYSTLATSRSYVRICDLNVDRTDRGI